jgi:rRNA maturation RNase YbeY
MATIHFFTEEIDFKLEGAAKTKQWIKSVIKAEGSSLEALSIIFCSDGHLLAKNIEYLNHNTLTDIITFDTSEKESIEGDLFISIDRIKDNATKLSIPFRDELDRVIIHGVLHLLGYGDKGIKQKKLMREKEDSYLSLR